ncbi:MULTISPECIES: endolytic transglycosylase MltG [unclassified Streptomyces]|uniref:endolytic transglycosylase MltG n=1 Tax=unclassified Streptomyces TaxID=2593676 RepID=UPI00380E1489
MTDYGRSSGSEAWHPEDPLFGDQWGQQQPQQHPHQQQPHPQAQQQQQQYPQQHSQQQQQYPQQHPQQQPQQYQQQGGWDPYAGTGQQPQYPYDPQQQQYDPSWGNPAGYGGDPYAGGQPQPDYYGQNGYPPPQPPDQRYQEQQQVPQGYEQTPPEQVPQRPQPQPQRPQPQRRQQEPSRPEWDDEAEAADDHAFFSGGGDDDEDDDDRAGGRGDRRGGKGGKGKGGKKRRSGMACLVVLVVLGGGLAGVTYFGYGYYQSHFGPAPDFAGQGSGEVQVEIPQGASGIEIGNILKKAGVVKSVDAFTTASNQNPKGNFIQAGVYVLKKQMSAASAVKMMLDPTSQKVLIIAEGLRDAQIYSTIDAKLGLDEGTTKKVATAQADKLGMPSWADDGADIKDPLEGFLFPSRYSIAKDMKPEELLKQMVKQATAEYEKDDLQGQAKKAGMSPHEVITIASLVQAEAKEDDEFGKVSRVIYNRLDQDMFLGFDSTINYAKGRSTLNTSTADTKDPSPYNTYNHKGLPPGPIGNPGHQAIEAALHPTKGNWLYFVTVKPGDTRFTNSQAEHDKNVKEFNEYQREHGG